MENQISFSQAQAVRETLTNAAYTPELLASIGNYEARILKESANEAIESAFLGNSLKARKALAVADDFYRKNIKKYDDVLIAKITRDSHKAGAVPNSQIVKTISDTKDPVKINKIKSLVGEEVWAKVKREQFDNMMEASKSTTTGEVAASGLFRQIKKMDEGFGAVFGKDAPRIRRIARELEAMGGKIDPSLLTKTGNVRNLMEAALIKQKELDAFMDTNFIKGLQGEGKTFDDTVAYLFNPMASRVRAINEAKKFFGENSPEWIKIKTASILKLLDPLIDTTTKPSAHILTGGPFAKAVKENQANIRAMFGDAYFSKIEKFSKVSQFLTEEGKGFTGGLVAAVIALHPLKTLPTVLRLMVMTRILATNKMLDIFTRGLQPATRSGFDAVSRGAVQTMGHELNRIIETTSKEMGLVPDAVDISDAIKKSKIFQ